MTKAAAPASATGCRCVGTTTAVNRPTAGGWSSPNPASWSGAPRPDGPTPPPPPSTRPDAPGRALLRLVSDPAAQPQGPRAPVAAPGRPHRSGPRPARPGRPRLGPAVAVLRAASRHAGRIGHRGPPRHQQGTRIQPAEHQEDRGVPGGQPAHHRPLGAERPAAGKQQEQERQHAGRETSTRDQVMNNSAHTARAGRAGRVSAFSACSPAKARAAEGSRPPRRRPG